MCEDARFVIPQTSLIFQLFHGQISCGDQRKACKNMLKAHQMEAEVELGDASYQSTALVPDSQ